jgi:hypothetical protein
MYFYVISGFKSPKVKGFYTSLETSDGKARSNSRDIHPLNEIWIDGR